MDDRVLALCEISNDLLFHKIPEERLSGYVDGALAEGYKAAAEFAGMDIDELYRQKKIAVDYQEDGKGAFGMAYRGQITLEKDNSRVVVFRSAIRALAEQSGDGAYPEIAVEQARKIHLAHEFFHFLEYERNRFVSHLLEPVTTFQLFGLKRHAYINRCSEAAAHAFAKTLLNMPVMPNYYDYLYLINTGVMKREGLEEKLADCRQRLDPMGIRQSRAAS